MNWDLGLFEERDFWRGLDMAEELCRSGEVDKVSRMFKLDLIVQPPPYYLHRAPDMVQTADSTLFKTVPFQLSSRYTRGSFLILTRHSCPWKTYTIIACISRVDKQKVRGKMSSVLEWECELCKTPQLLCTISKRCSCDVSQDDNSAFLDIDEIS